MSVCTPCESSKLLAFACKCGEPYQSAKKNVGRKFDCGKCGRVVEVPQPDIPPVPLAIEMPIFDLDALDRLELTDEQDDEPEPVPIPVSVVRSSPPQKMANYMAYPASYWLRCVLVLVGVVCLLAAGICLMVMVTILASGDPKTGTVTDATSRSAWFTFAAALALAFHGVVCLAMQELIGGLVAYFVKNECNPA